ncbi:MAG TPA: isocitrate lyase/phosphoenolpyruvate mutase family protein [Nocardioides sp.]|jgi:2-methylisocitrate lyase-like PEP mutase family enzyme|uniref:isocitrate lyase/PEP mutase family protein n=1 Tax=Nocardioides sp. TaxID=35761 RepID=UPI002E35F7E6|nr:isocitrate lyase/phosphoenolpyruvate mutase family protein [Nocardioides sp.]HEX3929912.1 isocitrate lyase/phosphoenolpyruvate mutase family protein [Nocardioides sp.]
MTSSTAERASALLALHADPTLLSLVNVWDAASARVVAQTSGTTAIATASHAIAAAHGYDDGEQIPRDLMLEAVGRIVAAVDLPVTADLEAGYGDPAETVRRAIGLGVVGCNIEDQLKPVDEATAVVEAVLRAALDEGVPDFVLNARTDAFLKAGERDPAEVLADAVVRGRAYLDAGAPVVFVPGRVSEEQVEALVQAFGPQRLTMLPVPGCPSLARLAELGVARVSFGPFPQQVALTALQEMVEGVGRGEGIPAGTRPLT